MITITHSVVILSILSSVVAWIVIIWFLWKQFCHGGHRGRVSDFNWNSSENLVMASVEEENNVLQIWQMSETIYLDSYENNMGGSVKKE